MIEPLINEINNRTGIELYKWSEIKNKGVNNKVWIVTCKRGKNYALKQYKPKQKRSDFDRFLAETTFLRHCKCQHINNVPELIYGSSVKRFNLQSWIKGEKPAELTASDIDQIVHFIKSINRNKECYRSNKFKPAPDSISKKITAADRLQERLLETKKNIQKFDSMITKSSKYWLEKILIRSCQAEINSFNKSREEINRHDINKENIILSPSDVGLHNTIREQSELKFIDFEYSGLDDIAKLTADWIIHPEFSFDKELERHFIEGIDREIVLKDRSWIAKYLSIKKLSILKWCLIVVKQGFRSKQRQNLEQSVLKAVKYYEHHAAALQDSSRFNVV